MDDEKIEETPLPPHDHFGVHTSAGRFSPLEDGEHQPPWLKGDAFAPSTINPNLSGSWIEREPGTFQAQLNRISAELWQSERTVRKNHSLATVLAETIMRLGKKYSRDLHVFFCPDEEKRLPSHSEIRGLGVADRVLQQKIADEAEPHLIGPNPNIAAE